ncbi:hypothetical protein MRB53_037606 [Persea americana]|nr:hypothetical protein MRB53_037606 [Persea americana]
MAPATAQHSRQGQFLRQRIYKYLDNNLLDSAIFAAERLHALEPQNPRAVHLLALCHLRRGRPQEAYDWSRPSGQSGGHLGCAYVFAQACLELGKASEGAHALDRVKSFWGSKSVYRMGVPAVATVSNGIAGDDNGDPESRYNPDPASVKALLGRLLISVGDIKRAAEVLSEAAKQDPFMWEAFEDLCNTDPDQDVQLKSGMSTFIATNGATSNDPFASRSPNEVGLSLGAANVISKMNIGRPGLAADKMANGIALKVAKNRSDQGPLVDNISDAAEVLVHDEFQPPNAPLRKVRTMYMSKFVSQTDQSRVKVHPSRPRIHASSESNDHSDSTRSVPSFHMHNKRSISGTSASSNSTAMTELSTAPQRRSIRLFNRGPPSTKSSLAVSMPRHIEQRELKHARPPKMRPQHANREVTVHRVTEKAEVLDKALPSLLKIHKNNVVPTASDQDALRDLVDLYGKLSCGYLNLTRFQSQAALQQFGAVVSKQRDTPWVLAQIGKCLYERGEYAKAEEAFVRLRKIAPSRVQDMEVYSTILWHLRSGTELAYLSHEMMETARLSPESWCTIGNCFSLQKDHEQALKCFKRATQLDPSFAYGYTLQGHEYVATEEFDKALLAYRKAIGADNRHYNGWYGLGKVFEKIGQHDMAERHYRAALKINPSNAILSICLGDVKRPILQRRTLLICVQISFRLKKVDNALQHYSHACTIAPNSALARFKRARLLLQMQMTQEALSDFLLLKDMVPDESNVHFMLGRVYRMVHDKPNAIRHYTIAMNLDPKVRDSDDVAALY